MIATFWHRLCRHPMDVIGVILVLLAWSGRARALDLETFLHEVKATHPALDEARAGEQVALYQKRASSWLPDPKGEVFFEEVPLDSPSLGNARMTSYSIAQEIPFPGKLIQTAKIGQEEYRARQATTRGVERDIVTEAKSTYFELVANRALIKAEQAMLNHYRQLITTLTGRYALHADKSSSAMPSAAGTANSGLTDLLMAKMKKGETETALYDLEHQAGALTAKLNLLRGQTLKSPVGELAEPPFKTLTRSEAELQQKLLAQNSELETMDHLLTKAKKEVARARMNYLPSLEPAFMLNQRQAETNAYGFQVGISLPLWFNKNQAEIEQAKAAQTQARYALEVTQLKNTTALADLTHYAHEHAKIVQKYRREIVPTAQAMVKTAMPALAAGLIDSTNILQKLINYQQALQDSWRMWLDYQRAYALLERLVGENL